MLKFENLKQFNLISLILISIPFLFIFSKFFLELFLILIVIIYFYKEGFDYIIREIKTNIITQLFVLLYVYIFLNILFQNEKTEDIIKIFFYFRYLLYAYALGFFLKNEKYFNIFRLSWAILFGFFFIDIAMQLFTGHNILGYVSNTPGRLQSFFKDEYILGGFIAKTAFIVLSLVFSQKKNNFLFFLFLIITNFMVLASGERSAIIFIFIFNIFILILIKKNILKYLLFFLLIISIFFLFNKKSYNRIVHFSINEISSEQTNKIYNKKDIYNLDKSFLNFYFFTPTHTNYAHVSLNMFKQKKIFGHGPKSFRYKCKLPEYKINKYSCSQHPHNFLLQLLAELGIVGFLFFLVFFGFLFKKLIFIIDKKLPINIQNLSIVIMFISFLPLMPSGNFFSNYISILFILPLAIVIRFKND